MMSKFIFNEKEMIFYQKDKPNGWCIVLGITCDRDWETPYGLN